MSSNVLTHLASSVASPASNRLCTCHINFSIPSSSNPTIASSPATPPHATRVPTRPIGNLLVPLLLFFILILQRRQRRSRRRQPRGSGGIILSRQLILQMPYLVAEHSEFVLLRGGSIGSCAFRHGNGRIQMMMVPIRHHVGVALAFFLDAQFQSGYLMA